MPDTKKIFGKFESTLSVAFDMEKKEEFKEMDVYDFVNMLQKEATKNFEMKDIEHKKYVYQKRHNENRNIYQLNIDFNGIELNEETDEYVTKANIQLTSMDARWIPLEERKNVEFRTKNPIEIFSIPNLLLGNLDKIRYIEDESEWRDFNNSKSYRSKRHYILPTPKKMTKTFNDREPLNDFSHIQYIDRSNSIDTRYHCFDAKYGKDSVRLSCRFEVSEGWSGGFEKTFYTKDLVFESHDEAIKTIGNIRNIFDSMRPIFENNIRNMNDELIQKQLNELNEIENLLS